MHFTPVQKVFLDQITTDPAIRTLFYLTGGTALSAGYLDHRLSEDIDLFSSQKFSEDHITALMTKIAESLQLTSNLVKVADRLTYTLVFPSQAQLKVDFVYYDFEQIEKSDKAYHELKIDSLTDIAVNKLLAISQRTISKDYVDLYYLLKKYTVWDLRIGVEHKFRMDIEPLYLSSLFTNASELKTLPVMKNKLTIEEVKNFFLSEAKSLASTMVKP